MEISEIAIDHAVNPRNLGPMSRFHGRARITGPCGDTMEFWVVLNQGLVERASFVTDGCGTSRACGSMATCLTVNRSSGASGRVEPREILDALGGLPEDAAHCAVLAANTLSSAIENALAADASDTGGGHFRSTAKRLDPAEQEEEENRRIRSRVADFRNKIVVLSGKGGVGKSTVAVNLAVALVELGHSVGLLDADLHGPSIPTMLGIERESVPSDEEGFLPIEIGNLKVISLGLFLVNPDEAVIWRGPMKTCLIRQFLADVCWGALDYLIVDCPPGTGDEPLTVCQAISSLDGAIVVTTPQKVAAADVRKSITFCRRLEIPILGLVENMSGFACPHCKGTIEILGAGGGRRIADDMDVPFLGSIPIDPFIATTGDSGQAFIVRRPESPASRRMREVVAAVAALDVPPM